MSPLPSATETYDGFVSYEDAMAKASPEEPATKVDGEDTWIIMYTSGTTGKPKGCHEEPQVALLPVFYHDP